MKIIALCFVLLSASCSHGGNIRPVAVIDPWQQYENVWNLAVEISNSKSVDKYGPSVLEGCQASVDTLTKKATILGFTVERWPEPVLRGVAIPNAPASAEIWGATNFSTRQIVLVDHLSTCGSTDVLGHELGHIAVSEIHIYGVTEEIVAEFIKYGVLSSIEPSVDRTLPTAMYLSSAFTLRLVSYDLIGKMRSVVLGAVKFLLEIDTDGTSAESLESRTQEA